MLGPTGPLVAVALAVVPLTSPLSAGPDRAEELRPPDRIFVLDFAVEDRGVGEGDAEQISRLAREATRLFRERLAQDDRYSLVAVEQFEGTRTRLVSNEASCRAEGCALEAARETGAKQVIRGRVIKVSNLIWYLLVRLEDVSSGEVVRQEAIELKGQRDVILPRAVAALHRWLLPAS